MLFWKIAKTIVISYAIMLFQLISTCIAQDTYYLLLLLVSSQCKAGIAAVKEQVELTMQTIAYQKGS